MDPKAILQNKPLLIGIIAGVIILITLIIVIAVSSGKSNDNDGQLSPRIKTPVKLLTLDNQGRSLEIQALLAKEGIKVREASKTTGSKITLILSPLDKITELQRDHAIITIVKSGLMDKNIGLEIFDKGDFTSSREDKRIRLARAVNGELARLIKKIPGINDASVFVAIPKDTIFTSMKQPSTATIQLVLPQTADKLDRNIIRAITNLVIGSVQGLEAENISITDTNGNVYKSIMKANDDMMKLLEDKDLYMKKKIITQLDRLLGKGNYVVTVSTYLRETPLQTAKIIYSPDDSTIGSKQRFTEGLGDQSEDRSKLTNAVSSYLPKGMPNPESKSKRNYTRSAEEYAYRVGQTNITEIKKAGMLEEISIAVTINKGSLPAGMPVDELKELIATSANPKALANNVRIAFADNLNPYLAQERPVQMPEPESSGNPWWTVAALLCAGLVVGLIFIAGRSKDSAGKQQKEIDQLLEKTTAQEQALEEANQKSLQLHQMQQQMYETLTTGGAQSEQKALPDLQDTIEDLQEDLEENINEQEFVTTLKSWIETSK